MQKTTVKGGVTGIGGIVSYLSGMFTTLVYIMLIFEVLDYRRFPSWKTYRNWA